MAHFDQRGQVVGVQSNPSAALTEAEERELFEQWWEFAMSKHPDKVASPKDAARWAWKARAAAQ